jgi:serine/threonine protein phosphatase PrpC
MIQGKSKKKAIVNHQIPFILADSFISANQELLEDPRHIAESAGTTATSLVVTSKHFHIANVGDSRCLLITKSKGKVEVDQVTAEHGTDSPSEVKRINNMGGVVMTSNQYDLGCATDMSASNEAKRVWSKDGKYPGTAFTRSIGDGNAKDLGVIAEPECVSIPITQKDTMFVLGTDGIFDFISNDEVADIVLDCDEDLEKACRSLVGMAYSRWIVNEERTDDITVIVGQVHNSKKEFFHKLKQILPNRMYK